MSKLQQRFLDAIKKSSYSDFNNPCGLRYPPPIKTDGSYAAAACEAITIEQMGKLAEWIAKNGMYTHNERLFTIPDGETFTIEMLIKKYLEQL